MTFCVHINAKNNPGGYISVNGGPYREKNETEVRYANGEFEHSIVCFSKSISLSLPPFLLPPVYLFLAI